MTPHRHILPQREYAVDQCRLSGPKLKIKIQPDGTVSVERVVTYLTHTKNTKAGKGG